MNSEQKNIVFHKADAYAHGVYKLTLMLPSSEKYGLISQLQRSAISVPANIVEGFARNSSKYYKQFLGISYASLKESLYLLDFAIQESLLERKEAAPTLKLGDEVGAMLWKKMKGLESV